MSDLATLRARVELLQQVKVMIEQMIVEAMLAVIKREDEARNLLSSDQV